MADVTTKLLFACYTNHYTTSEAKALLAVTAVKSKLHRTRVTQLLLPAKACELLLPRAQSDRSQQGKAVSGTSGQLLPISLLGARQGHGTQPWSLGALHSARAGNHGMLRGSHLGTFLASKMSKEIILPASHRVRLFQAPLSSIQKRCIVLNMDWFLTKELSFFNV